VNAREMAWKIADAVLYEGYVLYPYRASAVKNQFRWQFGVVAPRAWSEQGGEAWQMRTECLIDPGSEMRLEALVRFLQVEQAGEGAAWEKGVERKIETGAIPIADLLASPRTIAFEFPALGGAIAGHIRVSAEAAGAFVKARVLIENLSALAAGCDRAAAMQRSLVGAHTLLSIAGGEFISLTDPPAHAKDAAQSLSNLHTWPVLVGAAGERHTMLSAPIILPDYPEVAPESQGDFYDSTEIDELLTLRVMTLTDEEKREAWATDERARKIIERSDSIPREMFERLHGALRGLGPSKVEDFFNPAGENPEAAFADTPAGPVTKGARVRLAPKRHADSMDFLLAGRTAIVQGVHRDVEDRVYVAVSLEGVEATDPDGRYQRFYYFYPDEIELLDARAVSGG
jgi:hypothetical protein